MVDRYREEVAIEICRTEDVDVQADPVVHRRVLKRVMHSLGLGLRHLRLFAGQLGCSENILHALNVKFHTMVIDWQVDDGPQMNHRRDRLQLQISTAAQGFARHGLAYTSCQLVTTGPSRALSRQQSTLEMASASCVGTDSAASGGLHTRSAVDAAIAVVHELGHVQRVHGAGH